MRSNKSLRLVPFFALFVVGYILSGVPVIGQAAARASDRSGGKRAFCSGENWNNGDRISFREAREVTVPASGELNVNGGRNGGVSVKGENRSDILIRACVNGWAESEAAAKDLVSSIRIETSGTIKASSTVDDNWSVSFEILVPRNTNVNITAHNGGIAIGSVEGDIAFQTTNGGVSLSDLAGSVKGRTTNGGVKVSLSGSTWRGSGLDVSTTNGGVMLSVPETYAANFETGTTNGGFNSDVPSLKAAEDEERAKTEGWSRSKHIRASMNGGGANIRVMTTNGGIKIGSTRD